MLGQATLSLPLIAGAFGAVVGSFLNVVIYRLPRDELTVSRPRRSFCPSCGFHLRWYHNVPILSWLFLGGACAGCKTKIPVRYLLVELLTALSFGAYTALYQSKSAPLDATGYAVLLVGIYLIGACVAVTFIDFEFKIIPDEITKSGMVLGVVLSAALPRIHEHSWLYLRLAGNAEWHPNLAAAVTGLSGLAAGASMVWGIGLLGSMAFRKEAMGLGDVKYMGMVGAFLGMDGVLEVFLIACVFGSIAGLLLRAVTGSHYIAFGPYLSLGVVLVLAFRAEIVEVWFVTLPDLMRRLMGLG